MQEPYSCNNAIAFTYKFAKPGKVILHTEYLLHDGISTLGNVGGTLGLFIGFSFTGAISYILNLLVSKMNMQKIHTEGQIIQVQENLIDSIILQKGRSLDEVNLLFNRFSSK